MASTKTYVYRDGARLTPAMLYWIEMLDDALFAKFRLHIIVSSGIRTRAEQKAIFLSRYVLSTQVNGRKVYDWRMAEGRLYARISPLGTVAAWDSPAANHVLENTGAGAVDLKDTGTDAGIMTKGSVRWTWMRDNIARFHFSNEGDSFGEPWHKKFLLDPWAGVPSGGGGTPFPPDPPKPLTQKEQNMVFLSGPDRQSPGVSILVVATPGVWDRYADSPAQRAALTSQYGSPVVLSLDSMQAKEAQYLGVDDAIVAAIKAIPAATGAKAPTAAENAKAVRAEFSTNPLK